MTDPLKTKPAFTLVEPPDDTKEKIEIACRQLCELYNQDQKDWKMYEGKVTEALRMRNALITAGLMGLTNV